MYIYIYMYVIIYIYMICVHILTFLTLLYTEYDDGSLGHTENQPGQGASQTTCHNHPVDRGCGIGLGVTKKNKWSFDGDRHCDLWFTFSFQFGIKNA